MELLAHQLISLSFHFGDWALDTSQWTRPPTLSPECVCVEGECNGASAWLSVTANFLFLQAACSQESHTGTDGSLGSGAGFSLSPLSSQTV